VARPDVHLEQCAVPDAGGAADRQGLDEDHRIEALLVILLAQAVLPVAAHPGYVDHALGVHRLHRREIQASCSNVRGCVLAAKTLV